MTKEIILKILRIATILAAITLVGVMSVDAFHIESDFIRHSLYARMQLPVCAVFLLDFFVNFFFSKNRSLYFRQNIIFLVFSIPYSYILVHAGVQLHGAGAYMLHLVPTLRAIMAMWILVRALAKNPLLGFLLSYIAVMILMVYFGSIIFYIYEGQGANPDVTDYWSALWWSALQATTLGASFYACTTAGKAVAMALSSFGVMMFPVFTVYLTGIVRKYIAGSAPKAATEATSDTSAQTSPDSK